MTAPTAAPVVVAEFEHSDRRAIAAVYGAAWALTLLPALLVAVIPEADELIRHLLGLELRPHPAGLGPVVGIAARNTATCAIPLLVLALRLRGRRGRLVADIALAALLVVNVVQVGVALGAYGPGLLPWLLHLPIEWGALAVAFGAYVAHRRRPIRVAELARVGLVLQVLCLVGAVVEIYTTPHL